MFDNAKKDAARSTFMNSVIGLSNVGAAIAAFVGTPFVYGNTVGWVRDFTASNYGSEWADLADPVWFLLVAAAMFFIARASLSTLLIMGGLALAARFL